MKVEINDNDKTAIFWLTNGEQEDKGLKERLKPVYKTYADKKYNVAVFCSGKENLLECTEKLLLHNSRIYQK